MNSQQDIFLQINPQEIISFDKNHKVFLKDQFFLDGMLVELILTESHIFLAQVVFNPLRFIQLMFGMSFSLIFLLNLMSLEHFRKYI